MHSGQCHCGNVTLTIRRLTNDATKCNCSLCRRYAALWGYLTDSEVSVAVGEFGLKSYEHGDRCISFKHCANCGCVTHYTSTPRSGSDRVAVNYNMFSSDLIESIRVRCFDGAESWEYIET
jgi:hypothetical protein